MHSRRRWLSPSCNCQLGPPAPLPIQRSPDTLSPRRLSAAGLAGCGTAAVGGLASFPPPFLICARGVPRAAVGTASRYATVLQGRGSHLFGGNSGALPQRGLCCTRAHLGRKTRSMTDGMKSNRWKKLMTCAGAAGLTGI